MEIIEQSQTAVVSPETRNLFPLKNSTQAVAKIV